MTNNLRNAVVITTVLGTQACVGIGEIQQTEPIQTMTFTGPYRLLAQCVREQFDSHVLDHSFSKRYVIYDSVKRYQITDGISHYSITITETGPNEGSVDLRLVVSPQEPQPMSGKPPSRPDGVSGIPDSTIQKYWAPVQRCVGQVKARQ